MDFSTFPAFSDAFYVGFVPLAEARGVGGDGIRFSMKDHLPELRENAARRKESLELGAFAAFKGMRVA